MKNAQMQFGETLMVVIVLVVVIMIGLVFYFNVQSHSVETEYYYREDIEGIKLARQILSLPEIQATDYGKGAGIDKLKLVYLGKMLNESDPTMFDRSAYNYYSILFGYSTIILNVVDDPEQHTLYSDIPEFNATPDPTGGRIWSQQFIFTTIYDPLLDQEKMAYLNITRYSRRLS